MQSYVYMWKTALQFYGRERRSVFWSAILTHFGISLIGILLFCSIKTISWVAYIYFILSIEPTISITVRRLHDVSLSGKRALLLLLPVIGWVMLLAYLICDSIPEDNAYGESIKYLYLKDPVSPFTPNDVVRKSKEKFEDTIKNKEIMETENQEDDIRENPQSQEDITQ